MNEGNRRISPSMVVACLALLLAMTGGAYAAGKIGSGKIKPNAIKTSKIKDGAVTDTKLAPGAVTADAIAPGAILSNSIEDKSITTAKLDPSERSEGFVSNRLTDLTLPAATDTNAIQTSLPEGNYVFTITGEIGNVGNVANSVNCTLFDANNPVGNGLVPLAGGNVFQQSLSLTGVSDGGVVKLSCKPDSQAKIRNVRLTAVRVANVTTLTATP